MKGEGISNALGEEINNALGALSRDKVPPAKIIEVLTKKYGQSVEFMQQTRSLFTPEQLAVWDRIQREHLDEVASIFPPAQQKIFRAN